MNPLIVEIIRHDSRAEIPKVATAGSVALDLSVWPEGPIKLFPGDVKLLPTGLSMHIKTPGIGAFIYPRSGLGVRGLVLGNMVGVIDTDYQGPLMLALWNRSQHALLEVSPGMRVAQMVFAPVLQPVFVEVQQFSEGTERSTGGFGHTGKEALA